MSRDYKSNFHLEASLVSWLTVWCSVINADIAPYFEYKVYSLVFVLIAFKIFYTLPPSFSSVLRKYGKDLRNRKGGTYGGKKRGRIWWD